MGAGFRDGYLEEVQRRIGLTRRQAEVAYCVRGGLTNERTAELLRIRPNTVKAHLRDIYKFLSVRSRAELVARIDDSLTPGDEPPRNVHGLPRPGDPGATDSSG